MKAKPRVVDVLDYMGACPFSLRWVAVVLKKDPTNLKKAWDACEQIGWLAWFCDHLGVARLKATRAGWKAYDGVYSDVGHYLALKTAAEAFRQSRPYGPVKRAWDREVAMKKAWDRKVAKQQRKGVSLGT